jgi:hypothetical protein
VDINHVRQDIAPFIMIRFIAPFITITFLEHEKSCVMILLCNYHCELGEPLAIKMLDAKRLACLHQLERCY